MKTEIDQLLPYNQFKALMNANAPAPGNPFATMADIVAGSGNVKSEYLFPVAASYAKAGISPMSNFMSMPFPVDAAVVDGRSRKIQVICQYSKTGGPGTINFRVNIGGLTLTFAPFAPGVGIISGRFFIFEVDLTFRAGNTVEGLFRLFNQTATSEINRRTVRGSGTWNKAIPNTIDLQWEVVTAGSNHTLDVYQATSILT